MKILENEYRSYTTSMFTLFFEETVIPKQYICSYNITQSILMRKFNLYKLTFDLGVSSETIFLDYGDAVKLENYLIGTISENVGGGELNMENKKYKISPIIILNALFKDFRSIIFLFIAIVKGGDDKFFWGLTIFSFGINIFSSIGKYLKSSLEFKDDVLIFNNGVAVQQSKYIKIKDIQNIDTTAKFIYRLFNLVEVDINVIDDSVKIGPIKRSLANEIINNINNLRDNKFELSESNDYLLKYSFKDLLLLSIVQSKMIITIFVILGGSKEIIDTIEFLFDININNIFEKTEINFLENITFLVAFGISLLLIIFIISLLIIIIKFFNFTLENKNEQLVCKYGLFNKKSIIIKKNNIQKVTIESGWRARFLGLKTLRITTTTNKINEDVALNNDIEIIPLASEVFVNNFVNNVLNINESYYENNGTHLIRDNAGNKFLKRRFFIKSIALFLFYNLIATIVIYYNELNIVIVCVIANILAILFTIRFYLSLNFNIKYTKLI